MATPQAEAESLYTRAAKAELSKDFDTAFRSYVKAATAFLTLSRSTNDARLQAQWRQEAGKALERAEKIKSVKSDLTPVDRDRFSKDEQMLVLKKSTVVNGIALPLWTQQLPGPCHPPQTAYVDPDGFLELSPEQKQASVVWRRPSSAWSDVGILAPSLTPYDIVQRVIADCSLCASIIVCLLHSRRFQSEAALPSLYPRGSNGCAAVSEAGRYELRVFFNGAHRRVTVDDQLPFHPDGTLMCMSSRHDIWPSIVEKAYLKLMGGYDFPGSNSTLDIHALAGWIPEYIELRSSSFRREQTWSRVAEAYNTGRCVLTLGTDDRGTIEWGRRILLSAHCYAVIDMREAGDGSRWVTILDSCMPEEAVGTSPDDLMKSLSLNDDDRSRAFHMSWDDVCTVFGSICASWNPDMFSKQNVFHGVWKASALSEAEKEDSAHQTLRLEFDSSEVETVSAVDVWVLLTRHRTDTHRTSEYISLTAELDDGLGGDEKVLIDSVKTRGVYTNSPHVLVRTAVPNVRRGGALYLTVSYDGLFDDVGFTVTTYSSVVMHWDETTTRLPFDLKVSGTLTAKSSGGNYTLPTYMVNPQYRLHIPPTSSSPRVPGPKAHVSLRLQASRALPVNVTAVWGNGERVFDLTPSEIVANSGTYSYGYASVVKQLSSGNYTVVVSAFAPKDQGAFTLRVESSHRVQLEPIPQEGAGMFAKTVRGRWTKHELDRAPRYALTLSSPCQLKIRLQLLAPKASTAISVALLEAGGRAVMRSGPYSDALSGAVTDTVALRAGAYVLVPSAFDAGAEGAFSVVVYSSSAGIALAPLTS
ncbi:cysteine proteinase [Artomyces pyxidatus]|uniref:Cysteine proteinase n=1 Tax=Artomyces pyxidatus TaxID=48021 RepID=A0ACB8TGP7_9AGAM|nr:cysteine proteinase [Artomyces pyxidatus]